MGVFEFIFSALVVAIGLALVVVPLLMLTHWWWTNDDYRDSPQNKWKRRKEERKRSRVDAKESGLPMYERIARSYERKAEKELAGDYPEDALRYTNKAKEVREKAMQDMANGEFL